MGKRFSAPLAFLAILQALAIEAWCNDKAALQGSPVNIETDPATLESMLTSDSYKKRSSAVGVMNKVGPAFLENLLVMLIKTRDCEKRYSIYEAIVRTARAKPGSAGYHEELSNILLRTRSAELRDLATLLHKTPHLLSTEHCSQAVGEDLRLHALTSDFESVRWLSVRLLSYYEFDILTNWSLHSKNEKTNHRIQIILHSLGNLINNDQSWVVREAAIDAAYWYGSNDMDRGKVIELVKTLWYTPEWRRRHGWRLRFYLTSLVKE